MVLDMAGEAMGPRDNEQKPGLHLGGSEGHEEF